MSLSNRPGNEKDDKKDNGNKTKQKKFSFLSRGKPNRSRFVKKSKHNRFDKNEPVLHTIPEVSFLEGSKLPKEDTFVVASWKDILGEDVSSAHLRHKKAVALAKVNARHVLDSWNNHQQHLKTSSASSSTSSSSSISSSPSSSSSSSPASSLKQNSETTTMNRQKSTRHFIQAKDEGVKSDRGERIHFAWDSSTVPSHHLQNVPSAVNKLYQVKQRKRLQAKKKPVDGVGSKSAPSIDSVRRSSSSSNSRRRRKMVVSSKEKSTTKGLADGGSPENKPKTPKEAFTVENKNRLEFDKMSGQILIHNSLEGQTDSDKENKFSTLKSKSRAADVGDMKTDRLQEDGEQTGFAAKNYMKSTKNVSFADTTPTTNTKTSTFSQNMERSYLDIHNHLKKHKTDSTALVTIKTPTDPEGAHTGSNNVPLNKNLTKTKEDNSVKITPNSEENKTGLFDQNKNTHRSNNKIGQDSSKKKSFKKNDNNAEKKESVPCSTPNNTAPSNGSFPALLSTPNQNDVPGQKHGVFKGHATQTAMSSDKKSKAGFENDELSSSQNAKSLTELETINTHTKDQHTQLQQQQLDRFSHSSLSLNFNEDTLPQPPLVPSQQLNTNGDRIDIGSNVSSIENLRHLATGVNNDNVVSVNSSLVHNPLVQGRPDKGGNAINPHRTTHVSRRKVTESDKQKLSQSQKQNKNLSKIYGDLDKNKDKNNNTRKGNSSDNKIKITVSTVQEDDGSKGNKTDHDKTDIERKKNNVRNKMETSKKPTLFMYNSYNKMNGHFTTTATTNATTTSITTTTTASTTTTVSSYNTATTTTTSTTTNNKNGGQIIIHRRTGSDSNSMSVVKSIERRGIDNDNERNGDNDERKPVTSSTITGNHQGYHESSPSLSTRDGGVVCDNTHDSTPSLVSVPMINRGKVGNRDDKEIKTTTNSMVEGVMLTSAASPNRFDKLSNGIAISEFIVDGANGIQSGRESDVRGGDSWVEKGVNVESRNNDNVGSFTEDHVGGSELLKSERNLLRNQECVIQRAVNDSSGGDGSNNGENGIVMVGCDGNEHNKEKIHASKGRELFQYKTAATERQRVELDGVAGIDAGNEKGDNYRFLDEGSDKLVCNSRNGNDAVQTSDNGDSVYSDLDCSYVNPTGSDRRDSIGDYKYKEKELVAEKDSLETTVSRHSVFEDSDTNLLMKSSQNIEFNENDADSKSSIMSHLGKIDGSEQYVSTIGGKPSSLVGDSRDEIGAIISVKGLANQNKEKGGLGDDDHSNKRDERNVLSSDVNRRKDYDRNTSEYGSGMDNVVNSGTDLYNDNNLLHKRNETSLNDTTSMVRRETIDNLSLESNFKDIGSGGDLGLTLMSKVRDNHKDVIYTKPVMFRPKTAGKSGYVNEQIFLDRDKDWNDGDAFGSGVGGNVVASYLSGGGGRDAINDPRWSNDISIADDDIKFINTDADYYEVFGYDDETTRILEATRVYPLENIAERRNRKNRRELRQVHAKSNHLESSQMLKNSTKEGKFEQGKLKNNDSRTAVNSKKIVPKLTLNISPERNHENVKELHDKNRSREGHLNLSNEEKETKSKQDVREMVARCESDDSIYRNSQHSRFPHGKTLQRGARKLPTNKSILKKDSVGNMVTSSSSNKIFSSLSSSSSKFPTETSTTSKYNPDGGFVPDYKKLKNVVRHRKLSYETLQEETPMDSKLKEMIHQNQSVVRDLDLGATNQSSISYKSFTHTRRRIGSEADIDTNFLHDNATHSKTNSNENRVVAPGNTGTNFSHRKFTGNTGNSTNFNHQPLPPSSKEVPTASEGTRQQDSNANVEKGMKLRDIKRGRINEEKLLASKNHSEFVAGDHQVFVHRDDFKRRHVSTSSQPDAFDDHSERVKHKLGANDDDTDEDIEVNTRLSQSFNGRATKSVHNIPLSLSLPRQNKLFKEGDAISKASPTRPNNKTILTPLITGKEKETSRIAHAQVTAPFPPPAAKPRKLKPIIHHSSAQKQRHGVTSGL